MADITKQLKEINVELEELEAHRERIPEELARLEKTVEELAARHAFAASRGRISGRGNSRDVALSKELESARSELGELRDLLAGLESLKSDLAQREARIKFAANDVELRALIPRLGELREEYIEIRRRLSEVVIEYNKKSRRASHLHQIIPETARLLGDEVEETKDYGTIPSIPFGVGAFRITLKMLRGGVWEFLE